MDELAISVIIPTYKPDNYIFENLDILRQQTLSKDVFEVIIVLNGEREPYFSRINSYVLAHPELHIRLLYTDRSGVSNARSVGIDEARGKYIAFFDDDDWVSPNYLENLLALTDGRAVVISNVKLMEDGTGRQLSYYMTEAYSRQHTKSHSSIFESRSFMSAVWGKLIPREVIADDRFPDNYVLGQDALFMFIISSRISAFRFASDDTVYHVRYRLNSASHRHRSYLKRVKVAAEVSSKYCRVYFGAPAQYNFPFFLSRVVATLRKLLQRSYEVTPTPIS